MISRVVWAYKLGKGVNASRLFGLSWSKDCRLQDVQRYLRGKGAAIHEKPCPVAAFLAEIAHKFPQPDTGSPYELQSECLKGVI